MHAIGSLRAAARVRLTLISATLLAGLASSGDAQVITFEQTPAGAVPVDDAALPFATPYTIAGVQVAFGFDLDANGSVDADAAFERTGGSQLEPQIGFVGSNGVDTADTAALSLQLGQWFLRSQTSGSDFGRFVIQYTSASPVTAASGEIWDIDGQPSIPATEQYTVQAFDAASTLLATQVSPLGTLDTATAPLDGQPWAFSFSGLSDIDHIWVTFTGTKTSGIGLAFNNFRPTTAAPEPGGVVMALAGMAAAALRRKRRAES
jgi:MYXO-CTERM domain-containing protein